MTCVLTNAGSKKYKTCSPTFPQVVAERECFAMEKSSRFHWEFQRVWWWTLLKTLYHFLPGSKTLSFGLPGCNLACQFCQNHHLSQTVGAVRAAATFSPEQIVHEAQKNDCRSIAFTYSEPIVWSEFAMAVAERAHAANLKTVAVTNGFVSETHRPRFFACMDAANVDLKSIRNGFYREYCSGNVEPVLNTLRYLARESCVHLEVTNLLIPTLNDSDEEVNELAVWVRKNLGAETPLHFSAFQPAFKMQTWQPTPPQTVFRAREIALNEGLVYVYTGNIDDVEGQITVCPQCHQTIVVRNGYTIDELHLNEEGCCGFCGQSFHGVTADG